MPSTTATASESGSRVLFSLLFLLLLLMFSFSLNEVSKWVRNVGEWEHRSGGDGANGEIRGRRNGVDDEQQL
ncbi:hypothetical protein LguiB_001833 [Lonicera macranthoides]